MSWVTEVCELDMAQAREHGRAKKYGHRHCQLTILLAHIIRLHLRMQLRIKQLCRRRRLEQLHKGRDDTFPFGRTQFRDVALEELLEA